MLVITLGTPASGSTWVFNVVRYLLACSERPYISLTADDGVDALDKMSLNGGHVVLKSHGMDQRLMKIAHVAEAKVIISIRDPLDSLVSQMERFSHSPRHAAVDLTRSLVTIASLADHVEKRIYRYEDRFTEDESTIAEIARFLGLNASPDQVHEIFRSLVPSEVKAFIEERQSRLGADVVSSQDPVTQWHPGHLGDGRIGKWVERLSAATQQMAREVLTPLAGQDLWKSQTLRWSSELFHYDDLQDAPSQVELTCDGVAQLMVFGPYLYLPCGRWRVTPLVKSTSFLHSVLLEADINLPNNGDEIVAFRQGRVGQSSASNLVLEFDHRNHFAPVETRLTSVRGERGDFRFSGCELKWLGPCH